VPRPPPEERSPFPDPPEGKGFALHCRADGTILEIAAEGVSIDAAPGSALEDLGAGTGRARLRAILVELGQGRTVFDRDVWLRLREDAAPFRISGSARKRTFHLTGSLCTAAELWQAERLERLHRAVQRMLREPRLRSLMATLAEVLQQVLPAADTVLLLLSKGPIGPLQPKSSFGFSDERVWDTSVSCDDALVLRAWSSDIPLRPPIDQLRAWNPDSVDFAEAKDALLAALHLDPFPGALVMLSDRAEAFSATDVPVLKTFADVASLALQNALLNDELERLVVTDPLTGALNRRGYFERARIEMVRSKRYNRPLAAIMLDIDHFKSVNDTLGHAVGDVVLAEFVERLRNALRTVDILGRVGGEEFVVLLPETTIDAATLVAERLRRQLDDRPLATPAGELVLTASAGVAEWTAEMVAIDALMERADAALRDAKRDGRNRVVVWRSS
jgi:diguanylate cyclase (GGDEF)-like protein